MRPPLRQLRASENAVIWHKATCRRLSILQIDVMLKAESVKADMDMRSLLAGPLFLPYSDPACTSNQSLPQ